MSQYLRLNITKEIIGDVSRVDENVGEMNEAFGEESADMRKVIKGDAGENKEVEGIIEILGEVSENLGGVEVGDEFMKEVNGGGSKIPFHFVFFFI